MGTLRWMGAAGERHGDDKMEGEKGEGKRGQIREECLS